jgi:ubiquinone biosynthesis protein
VVPFADARGVIERELGRPLERCFQEVDPEPISSASLGQVHSAALPDGRQVAVKVLRPGVRRVVEADLQILSDAAALLTRQVPALRRHRLPGFVRQFATQMEDEMSYTIEAHNAERLRDALTSAGLRVRVPEVVWDLTAREVLTTERIAARRIDQLADTISTIDRKAAAEEIGRALLHQVFVDGFFHGDPHHGNLLMDDAGRLVLLDFGIVGYLDPRTRRLLCEAVRRVYDQDIEGLVTAMSELGTLGADTDLQSLREELARIVSRFMLLPQREFPMGEVLTRTLHALWLNSVRVPADIPLAAKSLLMAEGVAMDLHPDFDLREVAAPVLREARARELSAEELVDRSTRAIERTFRRLGRLPGRLDRVLSLMEHGGLRVRVEDLDIDTRWGRLSRALTRLALGAVTMGLLVGGAVLLVLGQQATHVALGGIALGGAFLSGLVVVLRTVRPGQL